MSAASEAQNGRLPARLAGLPSSATSRWAVRVPSHRQDLPPPPQLGGHTLFRPDDPGQLRPRSRLLISECLLMIRALVVSGLLRVPGTIRADQRSPVRCRSNKEDQHPRPATTDHRSGFWDAFADIPLWRILATAQLYHRGRGAAALRRAETGHGRCPWPHLRKGVTRIALKTRVTMYQVTCPPHGAPAIRPTCPRDLPGLRPIVHTWKKPTSSGRHETEISAMRGNWAACCSR